MEEPDELKEEKILSVLDKTTLHERLCEIREVYRELGEKQQKFCDTFCVHCKPGCGSCCEHFVPDISETEAEYLAFGLIAEGIDEEVLRRLSERDPASPECPLYNKEDPAHHCTVYRFRPMICRLFGATASEDKNGNPAFRHCKWNDGGKDVGASEFAEHPEDLILMGSFGRRLDEIDRDDVETELLPDALAKACAKIRLMLELEEEQNER